MMVRQQMTDRKVCVLIPTYNNGGTIVDVVERTAAVAPDIVVVVDGSTDDTCERLARWQATVADREAAGEMAANREGAGQRDASLTVVEHDGNRGKGQALLTGFKYAINKGFEYVVTLDADGQHYPEDIPLLMAESMAHPEALIVGSRNLQQVNMPGGSIFANRFSNFWFAVQTGLRLPDTQTGFRLYPLRHLSGVHLITARYEAELELLVFAAWAGKELRPVPVQVYYPPQGERVSHFRPLADFGRISLLNTVFCLVAIFYGWPKALIRRLRGGR